MSARIDKTSNTVVRPVGAQPAQKAAAFKVDPAAIAAKQAVERAPRGPDLFSQSIKEATDGDEGLQRIKGGSERGDGESVDPVDTPKKRARVHKAPEAPNQNSETSAEDAVAQALRKRKSASKVEQTSAVKQSGDVDASIADKHERLMLDTTPLKRSEIATFMGAGPATRLASIFGGAKWQPDHAAPEALNSQLINKAFASQALGL